MADHGCMNDTWLEHKCGTLELCSSENVTAGERSSSCSSISRDLSIGA